MSTPNGLSNLIIKKAGKKDSLSFQFKNYTKADGLQAREFNEYPALKTRQGELLFGGPNGFNMFNSFYNLI